MKNLLLLFALCFGSALVFSQNQSVALSQNKIQAGSPDILNLNENFENYSTTNFSSNTTSHAVVWNNHRNCCLDLDPSTNTITKLSGGKNWNCGLSSMGYLPYNENGFVKMTIDKTNQMFILGLTEQDVNMSYEYIDYGLVLQQGLNNKMQLNVFEKGKNEGKKATVYADDVISIERANGGEVVYKVNNKIIYTSIVSNSNCLFVDCSLYNEGAVLTNITLSENWSSNNLNRTCQ